MFKIFLKKILKFYYFDVNIIDKFQVIKSLIISNYLRVVTSTAIKFEHKILITKYFFTFL